VIHGDADDFAPIELAEQLVNETPSRRPLNFIRVPGANHFLSDSLVEIMMGALDSCAAALGPPKPVFELPKLPSLSSWLARKPAIQPPQGVVEA
jgi:fermentation-respiration switch protein FrsA (DUF1100 family)